MPVECFCKQCGSRFFKPPAAIRDGRGIFCRRQCASEWKGIAYKGRKTSYQYPTGPANHNWKGIKIPIPCPVCGTMFSRCSSSQKTCSNQCGHKLTGITNSGENNPNWKGIDVHLRRNYRAIVGDLFKHCERCHRTQCRLVAHHKDHDRTNNTVSNIEVLCYSCHTLEHSRSRRLTS